MLKPLRFGDVLDACDFFAPGPAAERLRRVCAWVLQQAGHEAGEAERLAREVVAGRRSDGGE